MKTRGKVNEETFNQVKELQKMGASAAKTARFVRLSQATVSRMFHNEAFSDYKEFVRSLSTTQSNNKRTSIIEPVPQPKGEVQELTEAIIRLAVAIEESNNKKKGLW